MFLSDLDAILGEVLLFLAALAGLVYGLASRRARRETLITYALATLMIVLALWFAFGRAGVFAGFAQTYLDDTFGRFVRILLLLAGALSLIIAVEPMGRRGFVRVDLGPLTALAVVGMMLMVSAADLIVLFIGTEIAFLALTALTALFRERPLPDNAPPPDRPGVAALDTFLVGWIGAALFLFGASLVFGGAGATSYAGLRAVIASGGADLSTGFGLGLIVISLLLKVAALPGHGWRPALLEELPAPLAGFLLTLPRLAVLAVLARLFYGPFATEFELWRGGVAALAAVAMLAGAFGMAAQARDAGDFRRFLTQMALFQTGLALIGVTTASAAGLGAMLLHLSLFTLAMLALYAFVAAMEREGAPVSNVASLGQLAAAEPAKAFALSVLLLALIGLPPLAGFLPRIALLSAAMAAGLGWLVVLAGLATLIAAVPVLRLIWLMFGVGEEWRPLPGRFGVPMAAPGYLTLMLGAVVMLLGIGGIGWFEDAAQNAANALLESR
ncbi:MAG: hypothetical protein CR993_02070 [Rhodobacterales bacterium]|nr:MAG: hypothetical protein CR993_02070 [Rhodobacterales bacterium]